MRTTGLWLTMLATAVLAVPPANAAPCAGFTDVEDTSPFCTSVTWMKNRGITQGCTSTLYCPDASVTRLQMAAFISRLDRLLPPTLVDANEAAFGSLFEDREGELWAFYRSGGRGHLLRVAMVPMAAGFRLQMTTTMLYFEQLGCTGQAYLAPTAWPPDSLLKRTTAVVAGPAGERWLYAHLTWPVTTTPPSAIAISSFRTTGGSCLAQAIQLGLGLPAVLVEDLAQRFVEPFAIR